MFSISGPGIEAGVSYLLTTNRVFSVLAKGVRGGDTSIIRSPDEHTYFMDDVASVHHDSHQEVDPNTIKPLGKGMVLKVRQEDVDFTRENIRSVLDGLCGVVVCRGDRYVSQDSAFSFCVDLPTDDKYLVTPESHLLVQYQGDPCVFTRNPVTIEVVDRMGSDLTTVNAARVSFGVAHNEFKKGDYGLVAYLAEHEHFSPFRHAHVSMLVEAPEWLMRQAYKHVVGIEGTSYHPTKDHAFNEISGRYTPYDRVYLPTTFWKQHKSAKQCAGESFEDVSPFYTTFVHSLQHSFTSYHDLLDAGVAKEQARTLLPMNIMTKVYWTMSLQAAFNLWRLRDSPLAQVEIREFAQELDRVMVREFPVTWTALKDPNAARAMKP